jgi:hypothetical protein
MLIGTYLLCREIILQQSIALKRIVFIVSILFGLGVGLIINFASDSLAVKKEWRSLDSENWKVKTNGRIYRQYFGKRKN